MYYGQYRNFQNISYLPSTDHQKPSVMKKITVITLAVLISIVSLGQKLETTYLNPKDTTANMYIAVIPEDRPIKAFLILLDGFGVTSPKGLLAETQLPILAAKQGVLVILPILATGSLYFGSDDASQESLKSLIGMVSDKYHLQGKDFYLGGFSIGGTCAVKYTELSVRDNYWIKPKAVFAVDPPLDWERFFNAAKRVVRLSEPGKVNPEVSYMIGRIEKEMEGTPQKAIENYYDRSPYSFTDTTQRAVRNLINTPLMLISEPDIQWWMSNRGYDYSFINVEDQAAMIDELQRLGNKKAILVTTTGKGYREPGHARHPHSWSIADPGTVMKWLLSQ